MAARGSLTGMRRTMRGLAAVVLLGVGLAAAQDADQPTVAAQMADMLARAGSGHSPTADEIRAVEGMPGLTDAKVAKELEPLMEKALANPDAAVRGYGLAMLVGMQSLPEALPAAAAAPASGGSAAAPAAAPASAPNGVKNSSLTATAGPSAYKGEVGKALAPLVPAIGKELSDDDPDNRLMAANALGGFTPDPPSTVYPALLGFLRRDDAIGPVGLAVVNDLLQLGPLSDGSADAIVRYLKRSDQTPDAQANLVEAIASKPSQNKVVDKAVVSYMDADDASLRARVILSLPALDLSPDTYTDTKAKVEGIASGGQENPQVVNAAKAVAGCWTQVKMTTGCPVY
jgi:hypothetical protein